MEQLRYNRFGQWTLQKTSGSQVEGAEKLSCTPNSDTSYQDDDKDLAKDGFDDKAVGETPTYANEKNQSFRNMDHEGSLKRDTGQKGSLRANPPSKSPKHTSQNKSLGKVPTPTTSRYADNNPGLKSTT